MCEADSSKTATVLKEAAAARHTLPVHSRSGKTFLACFKTPVPVDSTCSVNWATQTAKCSSSLQITPAAHSKVLLQVLTIIRQ